MTEPRRSVAIVGGGIVGLALARRLLARDRKLEVTVFEKEDEVGLHQTGHNSGVAHSGVYYPPGSLKARLTREGLGLLRDFCAEHSLPWEEKGKLIVAVHERERDYLKELHRRGRENGLRDLAMLDASQIASVEPEITGLAALHVPEAAIVDYRMVARTLALEVAAEGGRIVTGAEIVRARSSAEGVELPFRGGRPPASVDAAIFCAGQHADRLARASGQRDAPRIIPFFGRYWRLSATQGRRLKGLVYPVPDPRYPFLGVHFTPGLDGAVRLGPGALVALGREAYDRGGVSLAETREFVVSREFGRLATKHWRTGLSELAIVLSKSVLARRASAFLDGLAGSDLTVDGGGIRAQAVAADGHLIDDFEIRGGNGILHVLNAPSPAATASLAIAAELDRRLGDVI